MQRNFSRIMADSLNSNSGSPQQKLRKISFHTQNLQEYLNNIPNFDSQNVEGWGNQTWRLNESSFHAGKRQLKSVGKSQNSKKNFPVKRSAIDRNRPNDRKQYIQNLQEKLIQLVRIKKEREKTMLSNQMTYLQYLTPRKHTNLVQRTTSTSESDYEKFRHNFTNTSMRKLLQKSSLFTVKKYSNQFTKDASFLNIQESYGSTKIYMRPNFNRSMLTSYENMSHKSKQISLIAYPVLESQRKPRHRKLTKLQGFKESLFFKHNPQHLQKTSPRMRLKKQNDSLFKIKVSEPKINQSKSLNVKY